MSMNTKEEKGIAFGLKAVYITVGMALLGGGAAWGNLTGQTDAIERTAAANKQQIERLTDQLNTIATTQSRIDERTKQILMRLPALPTGGR